MIQDIEFGYDADQLQSHLLDYLTEHGLSQSCRALEYASHKHRGQLRKEGIPYIIHPMTMACHALAVGLEDDTILSVILLHDVCEDCDVAPASLPFSETIRTGVRYMTYVRQPMEDKAEAHTRYYQAMRACPQACLVKLFDRCHNVSSMAKAFSDEKIRRYIRETKDYVYPLIEYTKECCPEYRRIIFLLEYQIKSLIHACERI